MREPLFIRFLNSQVDERTLLETFIDSSKDDTTREIIRDRKETPDLSVFKKDFANAVKDLTEDGINSYFVNYVNSYMKPSLEEFLEEVSHQGTGMEKRWVKILDKDAPWLEALICYNMCLYVKAFSSSTIKSCKQCQKFFTHKGKYASYCSEICKNSKASQPV
jgi:hypothetical protein